MHFLTGYTVGDTDANCMKTAKVANTQFNSFCLQKCCDRLLRLVNRYWALFYKYFRLLA